MPHVDWFTAWLVLLIMFIADSYLWWRKFRNLTRQFEELERRWKIISTKKRDGNEI